jgi:hypothetical protein
VGRHIVGEVEGMEPVDTDEQDVLHSIAVITAEGIVVRVCGQSPYQ